MTEPTLIQSYLNSGIEIDPTPFYGETALRRYGDKHMPYNMVREAEVQRFLPAVGKMVGEKDFASSFDANLSQTILESFSDREREIISQRALYHELTSPGKYWSETENTFMPLLSAKNITKVCKSPRDSEIVGSHFENIAGVLSKRSRGSDTLRGDRDSLEAFATLLTAPEISLPQSTRCVAASHFFAHSRLYQRAERQFGKISSTMPEAAQNATRAVSQRHLEAEAMSDYQYINKLPENMFSQSLKFRQTDLLDTARALTKDSMGHGPRRKHPEAVDIQNQVNATRLLVDRAHKAGIYSPQMAQASAETFKVGSAAGGVGLCLYTAEASRLLRASRLMVKSETRKQSVDER